MVHRTNDHLKSLGYRYVRIFYSEELLRRF